MTVVELIEKLQALQSKHGIVDVVVSASCQKTHQWIDEATIEDVSANTFRGGKVEIEISGELKE